MSEVRGYKVSNPDWTCRGFQYEVGKYLKKVLNQFVVIEDFIFVRKHPTVPAIIHSIQK